MESNHIVQQSCKHKNTRKHGLIRQKKTTKEGEFIFVYQRLECKTCYMNIKGKLIRKEPLQENKVCATCGYFHKTEHFDCEYWGDLPMYTNTDVHTCHVLVEGDLPHNLKYRIEQLEETLQKIVDEMSNTIQ